MKRYHKQTLSIYTSNKFYNAQYSEKIYECTKGISNHYRCLNYCFFFLAYLSNDVRHDVKSLHWSQASGDCGNDGLEFNESILKRFDVLQGKTFWIGKAIYKKTLDWIEILGKSHKKIIIKPNTRLKA